MSSTPPNLTQGIDNRVCNFLVDCFKNYGWTFDIFGNAQYDYDRNDIVSRSRPSIEFVPMGAVMSGNLGTCEGDIKSIIRLNYTKQRSNITNNATQIANYIMLMDQLNAINNYICPRMPGMMWVGSKESYSGFRIDYSPLYGEEPYFTIMFKYKIDLLVYMQTLEATGYSLSSPDEIIYGAIDNLIQTINVELD